MLVPLRRKSRGGRKTGSQIAHAHDEGNTDVNAVLVRQPADPTDLLEIKPARLLNQKLTAAGNQPLGQSGHLRVAAEHQSKTEIPVEEIFVSAVRLTVQLIRKP